MAEPLTSWREAYDLESECALELTVFMPLHYKFESERQNLVLQVLERLLGMPVRETSPAR